MNGWAIPAAPAGDDVDEADWDRLFTLLEDEVVPLYHERNELDVPTAWVQRMKSALWTAGKRFTTERMVQEYTNRYYVPAVLKDREADDPPTD